MDHRAKGHGRDMIGDLEPDAGAGLVCADAQHPLFRIEAAQSRVVGQFDRAGVLVEQMLAQPFGRYHLAFSGDCSGQLFGGAIDRIDVIVARQSG